MTNEELAEIEARANAATPGPWNDTSEGVASEKENYYICECYQNDPDDVIIDADRKFIAHARDDIPNLIAEIKRLRTGIKCAIEGDVRTMVDSNQARDVCIGEYLEQLLGATGDKT
jgi:hypothetical protein